MKISIEQISDALLQHGMKLERSFMQGRYHRISVSCKDAGQFPRHLTVMGVKFEYEFAFGVLTVYECVFSNEVLQDSVKVSFECTPGCQYE